MERSKVKRETDLQIISGWIGESQRVLDVGCGRGVLLEYLIRKRSAQVLGVDAALSKVQSCVKRGVPAYHGDADALLREFPDQFFDWIILSRTVQELSRPGDVIAQALRVAENVAIGFVNYGYWLNRWTTLVSGSRPTNEVFPLSWETGDPYNPVTIKGFEEFAASRNIHVSDRVFLRGNWRTRTNVLPNLRAGYAIFHLKAKG